MKRWSGEERGQKGRAGDGWRRIVEKKGGCCRFRRESGGCWGASGVRIGANVWLFGQDVHAVRWRCASRVAWMYIWELRHGESVGESAGRGMAMQHDEARGAARRGRGMRKTDWRC